jgi:hypothetical protein
LLYEIDAASVSFIEEVAMFIITMPTEGAYRERPTHPNGLNFTISMPTEGAIMNTDALDALRDFLACGDIIDDETDTLLRDAGFITGDDVLTDLGDAVARTL